MGINSWFVACFRFIQSKTNVSQNRIIMALKALCVVLCILPGCYAYFNNTCLLKDLNKEFRKSKTFDCAEFVIKSTDEIWNAPFLVESTIKALRKYMTMNWQSVTIFGEYLEGFDSLVNLVVSTRKAFPDLKLHMTDCFCYGNDEDGYKATMPLIHSATHMGHHPKLGAPTGKKVTWAGIPNSFVKKVDGSWRYTAEWNIPDAWSLYTQIGRSPPHPQESPLVIADCEQIFDWKTGYLNEKLIPKHPLKPMKNHPRNIKLKRPSEEHIFVEETVIVL